VQLDETIDCGDCRVRLIKLEIGVGDVDLRLCGVFAERESGLQRFVVFDSREVVAFGEFVTGFLVKCFDTPVRRGVDIILGPACRQKDDQAERQAEY